MVGRSLLFRGQTAACRQGVNGLPAARGFTLIELLVTIALVAVLAALAAPSFTEFLIRNRTAAISNELLASITRARNEAVSRNTCVTMCRSVNGSACAASGTSWADGWIVFVNADCNAALTAPVAAVDLISSSAPSSAGYTMASTAPNATSIMFSSVGHARAGDAGRFDLQFGTTGTARNSNRGICMSRLGRTHLVAFEGTCP
jgi:type IV fimbrial biogenesis protein FimT